MMIFNDKPMNQDVLRISKARSRRAFTLIEILVVIALSAVLFALLLIPLISALNYTHQAQSLTAMQDAVRITREELTRELSSALYVFDNTSHPFKTSNTVGAGDDRYTNFLDLQILDSSGNPVIAHAYHAKLDFVQPKLNDKGLTLDPTTGQPIAYSQSKNGSAIISSPSFVFPAASGTSMTRYWVGLKDPSKPYSNTREGIKNRTDNTYILYRAQFQLFNIDLATGKVVKNADGTTINENLFVPKHDVGGNLVNQPELDDPDFFRDVPTVGGDVNWFDDVGKHGPYPTQTNIMQIAEPVGGVQPVGTVPPDGTPAQHNYRVEKWRTIAKAVIPGPNVDLILLPHNSDNTLAYDQSGAFTGVAHSGVAHDPVPAAGKDYPIVNTSVTFRPGTVSGAATPATTSEYTGIGSPMLAGNTGVSYIPTVYTTGNQSWIQPYLVTLTPPVAPSGQVVNANVYTTGQDPATGDIMEYDGGTAVYDITLGAVVGGATSYIPMTINADNGTINFATPALLDPANDRYKREWVYTPTLDPTTNQYQVNLKADYTDPSSVLHPSPLDHIQDPTYTDDTASPKPLPTARIVPGSLRVYGPDATAGPGQGLPVLYGEAGIGSQAGENQYTVDYANSTLSFTGATNVTQFAATPVTVIYDYQANMAPVGTIDTGMQVEKRHLRADGGFGGLSDPRFDQRQHRPSPV